MTLRRVVVYDAEKDMQLELITNNQQWKAATIAALYKRRWDIETFFKLLKQNLNVKTFVSTSEKGGEITNIYCAYSLFVIRNYQKGKNKRTSSIFQLCRKNQNLPVFLSHYRLRY